MAPQNKGRARGSQPAKPSRKITEKVESVVDADRGMTIREEMASRAPITYAMVRDAWGSEPALGNDRERMAFLGVWALMSVEYADALLAELAKEQQG